MDDEEEDMATQPIISQLLKVSYRDFKTDETSTQRFVTPPPLGIDLNALSQQRYRPQPRPLGNSTEFQPCPDTNSCSSSSSPSCHNSEPMEDRGGGGGGGGGGERHALVQEQQQAEEEKEEEGGKEGGGDEEDSGLARRPEDGGGVSVEVQIGRKLREIGDQFDHHHAELFQRHQREAMPAWMRLTAALLAFLFPREPAPAPAAAAAVVPPPREEQR
ncbi:hypothetical protein CRUP_003075 [Coryphaenoides rupestris]|nr:hypothetical protein CRUP_003075 [Coryphaenoides rupestris]